MKDWLGNDLSVGDPVLYSSTSTLTGMNLGEVHTLTESKIQIKVWNDTRLGWAKGRIVTLNDRTSAFHSVTRYFGPIPEHMNG